MSTHVPSSSALALSEKTVFSCSAVDDATDLATTEPPLGWPYVAVPTTDDYPLARRLIGMFGLVLGGSAGMFVGGMAATLLAALLHPFLPHFARLLLLSLTLFSLAVGAIVGRRVLQRETFE